MATSHRVASGLRHSLPSSSRSRLVHSSAPTRATLQASASLPAEPEEIILAPIFDIFDAPSRLGESASFIRSKTQTQRQKQDADDSVIISTSLPRPPPSSLPPPIIFDGPARPRNLPLAFQRRVEQALSTVPISTRQTRRHHTPSLSHSASEPLTIEMFEGPARITRYSHRSSNQQRVRSPCTLT